MSKIAKIVTNLVLLLGLLSGSVNGQTVERDRSTLNTLTVSGQIKASDGTASAPSYSFAGETDAGMFRSAAGHLVLTSGSTTVGHLAVAGTQIQLRSDSLFGFTSSSDPAAALDTVLARDAANALAQRNGTSAQTLRVYMTYTDGSNYERLSLRQSGSDFAIFTEKAGTGTARALIFGTNATANWAISTSGHFVAVTDNTYDIGASGANRPRDIYSGQHVVVGSNLFLGSTSSGGRVAAPGDGVLRLTNAANTDFSRLQFGGTTSSFPSLKRSGTSLYTYLADDSGWAGHYAGFFGLQGSGRITSAADGVFVLQNNAQTDFGRLAFGGTTSSFPALKRSSTYLVSRLADDSQNAGFEAANIRGSSFTFTGTSVDIKSGSGSPEGVTTAVVGSLYLRTDGGANTTLYVKESGTGNTGWVAK